VTHALNIGKVRTALARLSNILKSDTGAPAVGLVRFQDGFAHATDGRLTAAVSCGEPFDFTIIALSLERQLSFEDLMLEAPLRDVVIFRSGRKTARVARQPNFDIGDRPPATLTECPATFLQALGRARQFTGDDAPWMQSVFISDQEIVATDNVIFVTLAYRDPPVRGMVPFWLIDHILCYRNWPNRCSVVGNSIFFSWSDGSWVRCEQPVGFSAQAVAAAKDMRGQEAERQISPDLKSLFEDSDFRRAKHYVTLGPGAITAGPKWLFPTVADVETSVDGETHWDPKRLYPVIKVATHFDADKGFFHGPGIRGYVAKLDLNR
jgi:hypothetical protein